ncbi:MAG: phosphopentomutase [Buchnera aphidicola (Pentalonia nigronervosa)]|jgi:phosphopentomutase|uniref:Phosphopentomutase n=1 Tax=Buchnera aphidicola (Pentalonia nigronervosa) TaxID=1309793 RepID=A0A7H1AZ10_9GAMM|nr:MAG: phosphopentomutase [Buchnera aphidicola (Pentalonia nigronervosa)]
MKRVFLIVLDSFGIGSSDDAYKFDDVGSDTFGHIVEQCFLGKANINRHGPLRIPNLEKLGIVQAAKESTGKIYLGFNDDVQVIASYGFASEISSGKDTTSGHWEIAGVPCLDNWDYFKNTNFSFPDPLLQEIITTAELKGILGNCHASGTDIIKHFGQEHIITKKPIFYTSSDSVLQIACHQDQFGLSNLYNLCKIVRVILDNCNYKIARVIARPFVGDNKSNFTRTGNRRDFSIKPHSDTIMEKLIHEKCGQVVGIGKIADIYSNVGITKQIKSIGLDSLCNDTIREIKHAKNNTIIFTNLVDFDSQWGHRRDVSGYAKGLEFFDARLSDIIDLIQYQDLLILTADHGCDPTWVGTEHTREHIPILIYSPSIFPRYLGHRKTFSDISQTLAKYFSLSKMKYGENML